MSRGQIAESGGEASVEIRDGLEAPIDARDGLEVATAGDRADPLTERDAWVVLSSVPGVGGATIQRLVAGFGGARAVLRLAEQNRLRRQAIGLPTRVAVGIREAARSAPQILARLAGLGVWTLTPLDPSYPRPLFDLEDPPVVLYGMGEPSAIEALPRVAIVGTRRASPVGRVFASTVAARLSRAGVTIVSGLALGIDGAAQAAVVGERGRTIAVIGGGHPRAGPRAHRALADEIVAAGGAIISEQAPEVPPSRGTYPRRNRLIAALSVATVVVEAPINSGALITARVALELGRAVHVMPGRPGDPLVVGSLMLLRDAPARPITSIDELLIELVADSAAGRPAEVSSAARVLSAGDAVEASAGHRLESLAALGGLAAAERAVAAALIRRPAGADTLVALTGLSPPEVASALTLLQARGWIQALGPVFLPAGPLLG